MGSAMTARMIPFPAARRIIVRRALELPPHAGERHISRSVDLQATIMRRKGVPEELIAKERISLEGTIRQRIWDVVMRLRGAR
jgi:hypothetical protein